MGLEMCKCEKEKGGFTKTLLETCRCAASQICTWCSYYQWSWTVLSVFESLRPPGASNFISFLQSFIFKLPRWGWVISGFRPVWLFLVAFFVRWRQSKSTPVQHVSCMLESEPSPSASRETDLVLNDSCWSLSGCLLRNEALRNVSSVPTVFKQFVQNIEVHQRSYLWEMISCHLKYFEAVRLSAFWTIAIMFAAESWGIQFGKLRSVFEGFYLYVKRLWFCSERGKESRFRSSFMMLMWGCRLSYGAGDFGVFQLWSEPAWLPVTGCKEDTPGASALQPITEPVFLISLFRLRVPLCRRRHFGAPVMSHSVRKVGNPGDDGCVYWSFQHLLPQEQLLDGAKCTSDPLFSIKMSENADKRKPLFPSAQLQYKYVMCCHRKLRIESILTSLKLAVFFPSVLLLYV